MKLNSLYCRSKVFHDFLAEIAKKYESILLKVGYSKLFGFNVRGLYSVWAYTQTFGDKTGDIILVQGTILGTRNIYVSGF